MHNKTTKITLKAKKLNIESKGFWYFDNSFCVIIKLTQQQLVIWLTKGKEHAPATHALTCGRRSHPLGDTYTFLLKASLCTFACEVALVSVGGPFFPSFL
jgi:hypothetical protein